MLESIKDFILCALIILVYIVFTVLFIAFFAVYLVGAALVKFGPYAIVAIMLFIILKATGAI